MKTLIPNKTYFNSTHFQRNGVVDGLSDGRYVTIFVRFKTDSDVAGKVLLQDGLNRTRILKKNAGELEFQFSDAAAAEIYEGESTTLFKAVDGIYRNVMVSIDAQDSSNNWLIVDGANEAFKNETGASINDIDLTAISWNIGSNSGGGAGWVGGISLIGLWGGYITQSDALSICFDSDGNFTWMGQDGTEWFGEPANILLRHAGANFGKNSGLGGDFTIANGVLPGGGVHGSRIPAEQAINMRYHATNDISVTDNGDGTAVIASAANGINVYSITNVNGFKIGDYVYVTGSTGIYPITAIESDGSEMTVAGLLTSYTAVATEYASVFRVGRRRI